MFDACSADGSLHCSQAVTQHSAEVMAVRLGNTARQLQAELAERDARILEAERAVDEGERSRQRLQARPPCGELINQH